MVQILKIKIHFKGLENKTQIEINKLSEDFVVAKICAFLQIW